MPEILQDYFQALERLKCGEPVNVPKGTRISNDSVSLEAGRKKGTIKKSRPVFLDLIRAIEVAAISEIRPNNDLRTRLSRIEAEAKKYRLLWEEALAREISLVKEIWDLREAWNEERRIMTNSKVTLLKHPGPQR